MMSFEILHSVQNDRGKPHDHRLGVINARSERPVAASSLCSNLRDLTIEDNVRKRPFSTCLPHPPTEWANGSRDKISANRTKKQVYLYFSEAQPFCLRQQTKDAI